MRYFILPSECGLFLVSGQKKEGKGVQSINYNMTRTESGDFSLVALFLGKGENCQKLA